MFWNISFQNKLIICVEYFLHVCNRIAQSYSMQAVFSPTEIFMLWLKYSYSVNLYGQRIWKRMNICICITESLCCTPKINIVNQLFVNKFFKKSIHTTDWALQVWSFWEGMVLYVIKKDWGKGGFCSGSVVKKNLPASVGDRGSIPGLGRSYMPQIS